MGSGGDSVSRAARTPHVGRGEVGGSLDPLFSPRSVAVIGATEDETRLGGRLLRNVRIGYRGQVIPVNAGRPLVQGLPAYPTLGAVPIPIDLALVAVPASGVLDVVRAGAEAGVRSMIVFTAGFGETHEGGRRAQAEVRAVARHAGMRVLGPNCLGLVNLGHELRATFHDLAPYPLRAGGAAVVSQSGAVGTALFGRALRAGIGVGYFCTTGNEADVTTGEVVAHLLEQADVTVVLAFLEGVGHADALLGAGHRALQLGKPIIALKAGTTRAATRAARSHTGAIAVPDRVVSAAFDRGGIIRVPTPQRLVDTAQAFALAPPPRGPRVGVLTASGGRGVMLADAVEAAGLELPPGSVELQAEIAAMIPWFGSATNPFDCTAAVAQDPDKLVRAFHVLAAAPDFDALIVVGIGNRAWDVLRPAIPPVIHQTGKPIVVWSDLVHHAGDVGNPQIAVMTEPAEAVEALRAMHDFALRRSVREGPRPSVTRPRDAPLVGPPARVLPHHRAKPILAAYGVRTAPEVTAGSPLEAVAGAETVGYPAVLKLSVDRLPHRTEHGGVLLGLRDAEEVRAGAAQLLDLAARLGVARSTEVRIVVQPMLRGHLELLVGGSRDASFGPVVTVALGGTLAEILDEAELCLAPLDHVTARRALSRLARGRLLRSARGLSTGASRDIANLLVQVGDLMTAEPHIEEIDLNPVIVSGDEVVTVDALIVTSDRPAARGNDDEHR